MPREEGSSYREANLVKLTQEANKEAIPPYTCMEGNKMQASCIKKSAKVDEQQSAAQNFHFDKMDCRPATKNADRQYTLPMATKHQPMAAGHGR